MKRTVIIGTRGSKLAIWQAEWVRSKLCNLWPEYDFIVSVIKTKGDKIIDVPLSQIGDKGLFTKELEDALLEGDIDLAVHSMKDVPVSLPPELAIAAVTERADPRDVLVTPKGESIESLPAGARLGTSSLRRKAQLKHYRPDLLLEDLRGNVPTRLAKMQEKGLDGIIVAAAGLERLNLRSRISQYLPYSICLPAVGQGAIGLEVRRSDEEMLRLLEPINHPSTAAAVAAERAFLAAVEGGCRLPVAALGKLEKNGFLHLQGLVASLDGKKLIRSSVWGDPGDAKDLGMALAKELLRLGAEAILREIRP